MKSLYLFPIVLIAGCASVSPPTSTDLCTKTVLDYGVLRDIGPADAYADQFTDDGEFHLGANTTKGRDALIARHIEANSQSVWRHNMTDIRIKKDLTGTTRFHIFTGPRGEKPAAFTREILGDYVDEFVIEDGKCKISSRQVKIVFDRLD